MVDHIFHRMVAELIGRSVDEAPLETSTGHPHAETVGVVVAAHF